MGKLIVKEKEVVVPGEDLAEGMDYLPGDGCYRDKEKVRAGRLGLVKIGGRLIKLLPLSGKYLPKKNDIIIGKVIEIAMMGWRIDTNSAYSAMLPLRDATSEYIARGANLSQYYSIGDYVVAKVTNVTSQNLVDLTMKGPGLFKLKPGRIIKVQPSKVPRIIGKSGSMVGMIKDATNSKIMVGQNGIAWIDASPEMELVVVDAIRMIEKYSHIDGLTDKVKEFLDKAVKKDGK